ncbi:phytochrome B-like isoform X1 [Papaver somniferum]|nr:phytochrome B-like isoform X1 [Papaver somniferum]
MSTQQQPTPYSVNKTIAQYPVDARLDDVFEQSGESGKCFDYLECLKGTSQSIPDEQQINTYLSRVQRGGHLQPFGCMIAAQESTFRVIAYSENASEMLDTEFLVVGTDVRTLFTPSSAPFLEKAFSSHNISFFNPLWIHLKNSGKPFFAILHKIDVRIVIDLEPASAEDPAFSISGAVQSQKLADRAILRLQALPGGNIKTLCDTVVKLVRELTGYHRVFVYKFHEDDHGKVVAESKRPDLEPYMGLHFPSTDIPQASRLLFEQNRVRIIVDCHARPVPVVQDEAPMQPLCLAGSTLRAPHGCHTEYMANMGSVASLAMSVIINENDQESSGASGARNSTRLWGLVVCHHTSARCISFPLRYACGFLMQVFELQLRLELQLASQMQEKHVLQTQALLCDMLLRDSPAGVITRSPSIMDLVKCDGAALIYQGKYFSVGVCPIESQIEDIVEWLLSCHGGLTGLSTDSLTGAGCPGASTLGDAVCGMAVAYISSRDILFWFRSSATKEIKWGGEKHSPEDTDDSQRMHPRSSFKVFLEIVKSQSLPWETAEMDAIHSLQLILRNSIRDVNRSICKSEVNTEVGNEDCQGMDEGISVAKEMVRLIETANAPIFGVDFGGRINGWNTKIAELTGLPAEEAIGKFRLQDLIYKEYVDDVNKLLSRALKGEEDQNVEIKLKTFGPQKLSKSVFLVVNACSSKDYLNNIIGVGFVGQDITSQKVVLDKFIRLQGDYKAIFHNPNPLIPPVFASDENLCCLEWNKGMEKLTGWNREEMFGKMLVGDIFGSCCRLESTDAHTKFTIVLHNAIGGQDTDKIPFQFYERNRVYVQALLTAMKRVNLQGEISGAFCFLQIVSPELQQAPEVPRQEKKLCARKTHLAYICQEVKNSLRGIHFMNSLLDGMDLSEDQKQDLETSAACERQMMKIIRDVDSECIKDGSFEFDEAEFSLGNLINALVSQVTILLRERGLQLIRDIPEEIKTLAVIGDQIRIQQVLVNFLLSTVQYTPSPGGWVEIQVQSSPKKIADGKELLHLEFRIGCPGEGLPPEVVQDMFSSKERLTQKGLALSMSMKILQLMNGKVHYVRGSEQCYFVTVLELAFPRRD